MQTVSGVASNSPTGPHTQIQNSAENSSANDDTPVRCPNTNGSTKYAVTKSSIRNNASVCNVSAQPGNVANASDAGMSTDSSVPTYGTKRSTAVNPPHKAAYGTPIQYKPAAMSAPNRTLMQRLPQQELTDAVRGLIHEPRRRADVAGADQPDEAIAQILALPEHEGDQRDDDDRARKRLEHRAGGIAQPRDRRARLDDAHRLRAPHVDDAVVELLGDPIHGARELAERCVVAQPQLGDLASHRRGVARELRRQLGELIEYDVADAADDAQRQQHRQRNAGEARQAHAIEHAHQRRQHERQHDAERQRQQHALPAHRMRRPARA